MFTKKRKSLGEKLRELRKSKSMTLQVMADKLGVSNGFLSEVERDLKMPGGDFFVSLRREFMVSIDYLIDGTGELQHPAPVLEEQDPYIVNVSEMMRSMDEDTKKDVLLSVKKEKLLRELLKERQDKKVV